MSFSKNLISGVSWTGLATFVNSFIQFIMIAFLAMFLSVDQLGSVSIFLLLMNLLSMLSEFGFSSALVQRDKISIDYFSTVLIGSILWGSILAITFLGFAEQISILFLKTVNEQLVLGLRLLSINIFLTAVSQVYRADLTKRLQFNIIAKIEMFSNVIFFIIVCMLVGVLEYGIMGFVYALMVRRIVEFSVFPLFSKIPVNFNRFKFQYIRELAYFGLNVSGDKLITFIANNLVINVIIGRSFGVAVLGQYNLAYQLLYIPQQKISSIIARVSFPAFSAYQADKDTVSHGYLNIIKYVSMVIFPINLLVFFVGPDLLSVFYGNKYPITRILVLILAIGGLFRFIVTHVGPLIYSKGRSDIAFVFNVLNFILTFIVLYFASARGIVFTVAVWVTLHILLSLVIQKIGLSLQKISISKFVSSFAPTMKYMLLLIGVLLIAKFVFSFLDYSIITETITSISLGLFVYVGAIMIGEPKLISLIKNLLKFS